MIVVKTANHHALNSDGSEADCCGCWNVCLDEDHPMTPYAQCNECGETRTATFPGIEVGS